MTSAVALAAMWIGIDIGVFLSSDKTNIALATKKERRCDICFFCILPIYFSDAVCFQVFVGAAEVLVAKETVIGR